MTLTHPQSIVGPNDSVVARLSGDDFMIILQEIKARESVVRIARQIIESFKTSIKLNGYDLIVSTSINYARLKIFKRP